MRRNIPQKKPNLSSYQTSGVKKELFGDRSLYGTEEKSLFEPDILAASQYFEHARRKQSLEPEKKLMLAVLQDAVECFKKYLFLEGAKGKAIFKDAEEWLMEKDDDWLFSFESICEFLNLNAGYVRNGLIEWKRRELSERGKVYQLSQHKRKKTAVATKPKNSRVLKVAGI